MRGSPQRSDGEQRLNPYSNGMKIEYNICFNVKGGFVLILILME